MNASENAATRIGEFVSLGPVDPAGVITVRLQRPPANTLTRQAYRELRTAATEVTRRSDVVAVIVFGDDKIFCSGDDEHELRTLTVEEAGGFALARHDALAAVAAIPKPTVAAVTGYALGSGLALALAADWRISGDNAKFAITETRAGLTPAGVGLARLAQATGGARAKDLAYSGRFCDAEEALGIGLVDQVVGPDEVHPAAAVWASRLTGIASGPLAAAKAAVDGTVSNIGIDGAATSSTAREAERQRYRTAFEASDYGRVSWVAATSR